MTSTQRQLADSDLGEILREFGPYARDVWGNARVEVCDDINEARAAGDHRAYAHVYHDDDAAADNVICVATAFFGLPYYNRLGILWHEVGHWLDDDDPEPVPQHFVEEALEIYPDEDEALDQAAANAIVYTRYGKRIVYDEKGIQRLEP